MKKILDALEALCRAVPGLHGIGVSLTESGEPMFTVSVATDDMVRETSIALGGSACDVHYHKRDGREWISAYLSSPYVAIHGPHRPVVEVGKPNEETITAALALADEAVKS